MRIGIDIDNVISNFNEVLLNECLIHDKALRNTGIVNPNSTSIVQGLLDWNYEEMDRFYHNNIERIARSLDTIEGAQEYIKRLKDENHQIFIISGRDNGEYKDPYNMTVKWLNDHNIIYDKLILTDAYKPEQKVMACLENHIDIMIDDSKRMCTSFKKSGIRTLIMDTPYNQVIKDIERVHNWKEIYEYIINYERIDQMKLIMASQGFTNDEIASAVEKLVDKPLSKINIAIINESYVAIDGKASKRWLIDELAAIIKYIGGCIDFVNIRAYDKNEILERLNNADLIYIVGGKQHVLSKLMIELDIFDLFKEICHKKVVMGTSAGSIFLGKQINSATFWKERYGINIDDLINTPTLDLVNFNIVPHYMRKDRLKWDKSFLERTLKDNDFTVYAINDNQAIIYNSGNISFVGGKPEIFDKNI